MSTRYDVVMIGAGIPGPATAREPHRGQPALKPAVERVSTTPSLLVLNAPRPAAPAPLTIVGRPANEAARASDAAVTGTVRAAGASPG